MQLKFSHILTSCLILLISSCGLFTEKPVSGGVLDETETLLSVVQLPDGQPSAQTQVYLRKLNGKIEVNAYKTTTTDSQGKFKFDSIPYGKYAIEVRTNNSLGIVTEIEVDKNNNIDSILKVAKFSVLTAKFTNTTATKIWIPQIGQEMTLENGATTASLAVPPGNYSIWFLENSKVIDQINNINIPEEQNVSIGNNGLITPSRIEGDTLLIQLGQESAMDSYITFAYNTTSKAITLGSWGIYNGGAKDCLGCGTYDYNTIARTLIHFNIPFENISDTAKVASAMLVLTPVQWIPKQVDQPFPIVIHKLLKPWKAGKGYVPCTESPNQENSAEIDGVTARDRYWSAEDTTQWSSIAIGTDDSDASTKIYSETTALANSLEPITIDVTQLVKEWAMEPSKNYGILVRAKSEFDNPLLTFPMFHSSESATIGQPALKIYIAQ